MKLTYLTLFALTLFMQSCLVEKDPINTTDNDVNLIKSGDLIVSNTGNDTVVILDRDGNFKDYLYKSDFNDASVIYSALAFDSASKEILLGIDNSGTTVDRILSFNKYSMDRTTYLVDPNLNSTLPAVARAAGGTLLVGKTTNTVEKFSSGKTRVGAPFMATITANVSDVIALANGNFLTCSTGTVATVRTFTIAGVTVATATSALPTPTLGALPATGCAELSNGNIAVVYSGATDYVRIYNSALSVIVATYTASTLALSTPGKATALSNGSVLVADSVLNQLIEVNQAGELVRTITGPFAAPISVLSVP